jgi:hypothetical protein
MHLLVIDSLRLRGVKRKVSCWLLPLMLLLLRPSSGVEGGDAVRAVEEERERLGEMR